MLDNLVWQRDRMLLDDLVFRLEHYKNDQWERGEDCFVFFKTKPLVDSYAKFWRSMDGFQPQNVFELGIWDGGSVAFWYELFHPQKHVAIDIQPKGDSPYFQRYITTRGLQERIKTYWGTEQSDSDRLRQIVEAEFRDPLDLVIDDASHMYEPTKASFETLFPLLRPGGLYMIEDWGWPHWNQFQAPDHVWAKELPLTRLVLELVQAAGGASQLIASMSINSALAAIERGGIDRTMLDGFKLEQHISLREQDHMVQVPLVEVQRQREELAKQQDQLQRQQGLLRRQQEEIGQQQDELAALHRELAWMQGQLQQMQATRLWRLGTMYWQAHARIKSLFQGAAVKSPLPGEPRPMPDYALKPKIKAEQKTASMDPRRLNLEGNRDIYAKFLDFRKLLDDVKTQHPLAGSAQYYPYGTIYNIDQMLPILDKHGIDLKQCVEDKTILDLGSGDGELSFFFELFDPKRIIAVDAAPFNFNHLEGFRVLRSALQSKVELIDADVHLVDFAQLPHFDIIFCLGFLYHSPHPMWVLEKLARSTRMLFLNTKVFDAEGAYAYFYDVAECNDDASNWWCYSPKTVSLMLKRAGFTVEFMERLDANVGHSHPVDMSRDGRTLVFATSGQVLE